MVSRRVPLGTDKSSDGISTLICGACSAVLRVTAPALPPLTVVVSEAAVGTLVSHAPAGLTTNRYGSSGKLNPSYNGGADRGASAQPNASAASATSTSQARLPKVIATTIRPDRP